MADVTANQILRRVKARINETGEDIPDAMDWLTTQIDEIEDEEAIDRAKFVLNGVAKDLGASDYRLLPGDQGNSMVVIDAAIARTEPNQSGTGATAPAKSVTR